MRNPYFNAVLDRMRETHDRKNQDYADDDNPYSNFEGAAKLTGLNVEQVFAVLIGIKVERLRQMISGKVPNYEKADDTLLDIANYSSLWLSYRDKMAEIQADVGKGVEQQLQLSFDLDYEYYQTPEYYCDAVPPNPALALHRCNRNVGHEGYHLCSSTCGISWSE
jgi:hypothetical protein